MDLSVKVYHNVTRDESGRPVGMLDGHQDGHLLVLVAEFPASVDWEWKACERAFHLFNVGGEPEHGEPDPIAVEYRARGNRSLSVGDVVEVSEYPGLTSRFYACGRVGWDLLRSRPLILDLTCTGPLPARKVGA